MNIFSRKNLKHILTSTILNHILNNLGKSLHYLDKHQKTDIYLYSLELLTPFPLLMIKGEYLSVIIGFMISPIK